MKLQQITAFIFLISILIFGTSCNDDFELGVGGKNYFVIYGLLNQRDTAQFIRISKTFSGNTDAMEAVKIKDSICPKPDEITLTVLKLNDQNEVVGDPIIPYLVEKEGSEPGIFSEDGHLIYKFTEILDDAYSYKIIVKDLNTTDTAIAQTEILGERDWRYSEHEHRKYNKGSYIEEDFDFESGYSDPSQAEDNFKRFVYLEIKNGSEKLKFVDWKPYAGTYKLEVLNDTSLQMGANFLQYLAEVLEIDPDAERIPKGIDYIQTFFDKQAWDYSINVQNTDLYHYLKVYTNVENGVGLFASRYYYTDFALKFSPRTLDTLINGQYTKHLGFTLIEK